MWSLIKWSLIIVGGLVAMATIPSVLFVIPFIILIIYFLGGFYSSGDPAPVIRHPHDRGHGNDFRRPGDEKYIIRTNQRPPKKRNKKFKGDVAVAGVSKRTEQVERFINGDEREVTLVRDPHNKYDSNAVKVIGSWTDTEDQRHRKQLGWLPAEVAKELADEEEDDIPIGATLETMFKPRLWKYPGLRIDVWVPRENSTHRK